jgi:hypothetical protein
LATAATGGQRGPVTGDHGQRDQATTPVGNQVTNQGALSTQGKAVTGVLNVRSGEQLAAVVEGGGAHVHLGVGRVGPLTGGEGADAKQRPVDGGFGHDQTVHFAP